jgi:hypothetical protein
MASTMTSPRANVVDVDDDASDAEHLAKLHTQLHTSIFESRDELDALKHDLNIVAHELRRVNAERCVGVVFVFQFYLFIYLILVMRYKTNLTLIEPRTTALQQNGLQKPQPMVKKKWNLVLFIYLFIYLLDFGVAVHNVRDLTDDPTLARKGYANAVYHLQRTKVR